LRPLDPDGNTIPPKVLMLYNPTYPTKDLLHAYTDWFAHKGKDECPIEKCTIHGMSNPSNDNVTFVCDTAVYSEVGQTQGEVLI
jgi:hypothetical protein